MSRTIRKDRCDNKYPEGNPNGENLRTYKCKCEYCTAQKRRKDKAHQKEFKRELNENNE